MVNGLNELSKKVYEANKQKGFDVANENIGQILMLIVSELSEALEADRKDKKADIQLLKAYLSHGMSYKQAFESAVKDTFEDEIADALIRILDLCGAHGIDIDLHVSLKLQYNKLRDFKHGKKY